MGAVVVEDADAALGVFVRDKVLAEEAQSHGRAIGLGDLLLEESGDPESA